jgi:hypothetical protein
MTDPLDVINKTVEAIMPRKKVWFVSKFDDYDAPATLISSEGDLWVSPDVWKNFVSNTYVKGPTRSKSRKKS